MPRALGRASETTGLVSGSPSGSPARYSLGAFQSRACRRRFAPSALLANDPRAAGSSCWSAPSSCFLSAASCRPVSASSSDPHPRAGAPTAFRIETRSISACHDLTLILGTIHPSVALVLFVTLALASISYGRCLAPSCLASSRCRRLALITLWPPLTLFLCR